MKDLKSVAIEKLEIAKKKQQEIIDKQNTIIRNYDRLKIGNIINCNIEEGWSYNHINNDGTTTLLIAAHVYVTDDEFIIPVRHHIYPIINENTISLNMSGVIDLLSVPIDKIDNLNVMNVYDYLHGFKSNFFEMWKQKIEDKKEQILKNEHEIERLKKNIKQNKEWIDNYENAIDTNIDSFISNYILNEHYNNSFKDEEFTYQQEDCRVSFYKD